MASGWVPMPVEAWPDMVAAMDGDKWPESLAAFDLRWHENEVRMGRRASMPGAPHFANRWGWTRYYARKLMRNEAAWVDSRFARPSPVDSPSVSRENADSDGSTVQDSPAVSPSFPVDRHTRVGEQLNNSTTKQGEVVSDKPDQPPPLTLLPPEPDKPKADAIPQSVRDAHHAFKATHILKEEHIRPLDAKRGEGKAMAALVKEYGERAVVSVYEWMATSMHRQAVFCRGHARSRDGKPYSARSAQWFRVGGGKHWDEVWEAMGEAEPGRQQQATDSPSDLWERAAQASSYQHPAWLEHVPESQRDRFARASAKVGGVGALGRCVHPLDTKALKQRFTQAYEEAA